MNNTLRILSRHPSHAILRRRIPLLNNTGAVLRLGSTTSDNSEIQINTVQSVKNSSDKIKMKQIFKEAGVNSPEFYLDISELEDYNFERPLLAKRTYRSKGAGMEKIDTKEQFDSFIESKITNNEYNLKNPYYFEVFYNYTKEYRIHVSEVGGYFYTNRKMLKTEAENRWFRNDSNSVWMLETNELFDKPETFDNIVNDCQKAREALELSICSFDVKVNKKGDWVILEGNSASSFGDTENTISIVGTKYQLELIKILHNRWKI